MLMNNPPYAAIPDINPFISGLKDPSSAVTERQLENMKLRFGELFTEFLMNHEAEVVYQVMLDAFNTEFTEQDKVYNRFAEFAHILKKKA